jgi:hypothetical protein
MADSMNPESWPHVTQILADLHVMQGSDFYKPRHRRRGSLVDSACTQLALGKPIPERWWTRTSGEEGTDDYVEHEECRPYVEAFQRVLAITDAKDIKVQVQVEHRGLMYQGTADLLWTIEELRECSDTKCGEKQDWHVLQGAGYIDGLLSMGVRVDRFTNIYLPSGKIFKYDGQVLVDAITEFRHLARTWHIVNKYGGWSEHTTRNQTA